jgi:hypothetical protein
LDPLEILKRAFDAALAIKKSGQRFDAGRDEELEAALRELIVASTASAIQRH